MKRRVTTGKAWIQRGPIVPWMREYIQWLAAHPSAVLSRPGGQKVRRGPPTTAERTAKASLCARRKITGRMLMDLEQRTDIVDYFTRLRDDAQYRAREMLERDLQDNIEARREGLRAARGFVKIEKEVEVNDREKIKVVEEVFKPEAVDHRAIKGYTDWVPELAFPKKTEGQESAPRITINIRGADAKQLLAKALEEPEQIQDVDYEVLETKQLTEGEDDAA